MIAKIKIKKLECGSCWESIEKGLLKNEGINPLSYDLLNQEAEIEFDDSRYKPEDIVNIIKKIGWKSEIIEIY